MPDEEPGPIAARRADALRDVAETYMNNSENSGSTADRYQIVVHVYPKGTLTAESSDNPRIENGPHVTAETPAAKWYAGEKMDWDYAVSLMST
ncbi:MAG: hypothetical protein OER91_00345 [Gammaproteobacteria bacterium]|nr:hypothetical protein [Gammaproteobacteria bacterium]